MQSPTMSERQSVEKVFETSVHEDTRSSDAMNDSPAVTSGADDQTIRPSPKHATTDLENVKSAQVVAASRDSSGFSVSQRFKFDVRSILVKHSTDRSWLS